MKKSGTKTPGIMSQVFTLSIMITCSGVMMAQGVGIGTSTPTGSAILEVKSTSKGLLPPRMTKAQRDAIVNPVSGLMIWCNNCIAPTGELQVYNGMKWINMSGGTSPSGFVSICDQDWSAKNLDVDRYRNGDPIPKVTDPVVWASLTTGAYCYYNNDSIYYGAAYGKLYNWYAVNDPRGLAPDGWHIPTNFEWFELLDACLGGDTYAGGPLKEASLVYWDSPNVGATNSTGFTARPGGLRNAFTGAYQAEGALGDFWSSTDLSGDAMYINLHTNSAGYSWDGLDYKYGMSVRCMRD